MIKKDLYLITCILLAAALLFIGKETLMHDAGFVTATVDGAPYGSWPLDKMIPSASAHLTDKMSSPSKTEP